MKISSKKIIRLVLALILFFVILAMISSYVKNYHISPKEIYLVDLENPVNDSGFENFNQSAGDCCNGNPNMSKVYASKSRDSVEGKFSLNLTSEYQCSCAGKNILNFNNSYDYLISFYYKGFSSNLCIWSTGDKKCYVREYFDKTEEWQEYKKIVKFTNKSEGIGIVFYANSDGTRTVTNLYDDLQVHKLIQISPSVSFDTNQQYIILTNKNNIVKDGEYLSDSTTESGFAYYLVTGIPEITLKFPLFELIIILILIGIIIILVFKKSEEELHDDFSRRIRKDVERHIRYHGV